MEPPRHPTPNHVHGCVGVNQPVLTAQNGPAVATKNSASTDRSTRSHPTKFALPLTMQFEDHVVAFGESTAVSCAGTVPDSWLFANFTTEGELHKSESHNHDHSDVHLRIQVFGPGIPATSSWDNAHLSDLRRVNADIVDGTVPDIMFTLRSR